MKKNITRNILLTGWLCVLIHPAVAQSSAYNTVKKIRDGLYFMYYDSSYDKSVIVEFKHYLVLLEVAASGSGGNSKRTEHYNDGVKILSSLDHYFPGKPLKYICHSHYHPHSLASAKPFLEKGITLYTTRQSYQKLADFIDTNSTLAKRYIRFIDGDSMTIADKTNRIVAYHISKTQYPHLPTQDYVYFYLPKYRSLYSACMYSFAIGKAGGKPLITGRTEDLAGFCNSRHVAIDYLIHIFADTAKNGMLPYSDFLKLQQEGTVLSVIMKTLFDFPASELRIKQTDICKAFQATGIGVGNINTEVYAAIYARQLEKALEIAKIQCLLNPNDPNSWDTIGEVYFLLNDTAMAGYYERKSRVIDPKYTRGGMASWEQNLQSNYLPAWNQLPD